MRSGASIRSVKLRATLAFSLCAIAAASADQNQPVFRAGVELVTVDVVATTRDGQPVFDLKAEDFQLFEDDVPQEIRTFRFLNFSTPDLAPILPAGVVTNQVEPGGIFAVVLDELGYQVDDIQNVRRTATRFFTETLEPNDHVVVVRSGANSEFTLTTDHALALDAISRSNARRERTFGITEPGSDESVRESTPSIETFGSGENGRNSFRVLLGVIDQLKHISARRKAILWFSRGGDLPPNITESFELGRQVGRDDDAFRRMIETARAANVAVYTIDPRGLQSAAADLTRDLNPMDTTALRDLAALTGGRTVLGNDANGMLEKVAAENRAYYLLGYEPKAGDTRRSRPRKLRVTTSAPGVTVLHRTTFLPGSESKAKPPELIGSPLPVRDLPILLAPATVAVDRSRRGIIVPFEIGDDLAEGTVVKYSAIALDPGGKVVSRVGGQGRAKEGRVAGEVRLAAETKTYQVRFAAQAQEPEVNGLAFATVRVPPGNTKDPECGGLVFEQPGEKLGVRMLNPAEPVTISTLVSATGLDGTVAPISFALGVAGGPPQKTWPVQLAVPLSRGLYRVALSLKPPLPRGNLEIQVLRDGLLMNDNCVTQFISQ
jgi:VWFA-related protein